MSPYLHYRYLKSHASKPLATSPVVDEESLSKIWGPLDREYVKEKFPNLSEAEFQRANGILKNILIKRLKQYGHISGTFALTDEERWASQFRKPIEIEIDVDDDYYKYGNAIISY